MNSDEFFLWNGRLTKVCQLSAMTITTHWQIELSRIICKIELSRILLHEQNYHLQDLILLIRDV